MHRHQNLATNEDSAYLLGEQVRGALGSETSDGPPPDQEVVIENDKALVRSVKADAPDPTPQTANSGEVSRRIVPGAMRGKPNERTLRERLCLLHAQPDLFPIEGNRATRLREVDNWARQDDQAQRMEQFGRAGSPAPLTYRKRTEMLWRQMERADPKLGEKIDGYLTRTNARQYEALKSALPLASADNTHEEIKTIRGDALTHIRQESNKQHPHRRVAMKTEHANLAHRLRPARGGKRADYLSDQMLDAMHAGIAVAAFHRPGI